MVPRLPFQEWEGFNAGESAQQMTGASRAWPGLTLLTLADIKTAAWLVENNHLTQLERITFTNDLLLQSFATEFKTIGRLAETVSTKSDDQIFVPSCEYASPYYYKVIPAMGHVTIELDVNSCPGVRSVSVSILPPC